MPSEEGKTLTKRQIKALSLDLHTLLRRHELTLDSLADLIENDYLAEPQKKTAFKPGDRVAWEQVMSAVHAGGSVLKASSLPAGTPVGTIVKAANKQGTEWVVAMDEEHSEHPGVVQAAGTHEDADKLTLTSDELVLIAEDE